MVFFSNLDRKRFSARLMRVAVLCGLGLASISPSYAGDMIEVLLDQAKLLKLPAGAETIVIGNPSIADVAVQKNGIMVLTGRASGQTNLIALDASGTIISESAILVANSQAGKVLVQRGMERYSYDCALTRCQPSIALGDEDKYFGSAINQATQRDGMASSNSQGAKK